VAKRKPQAGAEPTITLYAQVGLRLPGDLAVRLKRYCAATGRALNDVAKEALIRFLDEARRSKRGPSG
jgi:hypothetical protein